MEKRMFEADVMKPAETGWICPRCGKSNSPKVKTCSCQDLKTEEKMNKINWIKD